MDFIADGHGLTFEERLGIGAVEVEDVELDDAEMTEDVEHVAFVEGEQNRLTNGTIACSERGVASEKAADFYKGRFVEDLSEEESSTRAGELANHIAAKDVE